MKVTTFGTRGSVPVAGTMFTRYGGNTTCLLVESECIPAGQALVVDAGSGFVPLSAKLLREGVKKLNVLFTHYHHDHTQGLFLAPHTFTPSCELTLHGPVELGVGPQKMFEAMMRPPFFPVDFARVERRFTFKPMQKIGSQVIVVHPIGGVLTLRVDKFERCATGESRQLKFSESRQFPIDECMIIRMYRTEHPEQTISYAFEERPTGKVFVFLTDHEVTKGLPGDLIRHVRGADLLIQDSQYPQSVYDAPNGTAGFGHGTPAYCVDLALAGDVRKLGLTHHDPRSSDEAVDNLVKEALTHMRLLENGEIPVFACADYETYEV